MQPTNIEDIRRVAGEQVVELPGFGDADNTPLRVTLRRVSLLGLAEAGAIPNELMGAVSELYSAGRVSRGSLATTAKTMLLIARQAMVCPTLEELQEAGLALTDEQLSAIYLYSQAGVRALRPFRRDAGVLGAVPDSESVAHAAERLAGAI